jgi:hypothetical protein
MSSVLIVGGDQIEGLKEVFGSYGIDQVNHWSGRRADDNNKVIYAPNGSRGLFWEIIAQNPLNQHIRHLLWH